jgi:hypothetical protein
LYGNRGFKPLYYRATTQSLTPGVTTIVKPTTFTQCVKAVGFVVLVMQYCTVMMGFKIPGITVYWYASATHDKLDCT